MVFGNHEIDGFIPEVELQARRRLRREDGFLQDELLVNWAANLSERSLQHELDAADYRCSAGLAAAAFEFSGIQVSYFLAPILLRCSVLCTPCSWVVQ